MDNIVGVSFDNKEKIEYFYTNGLNVKKSITVLAETENGIRFGKIVTDIHPIDKSKLNRKLNKILRIATKLDYNNYINNKKESQQALIKCQNLIKQYGLDMKVIECYYTFNKDQLIFRFIADNRIDFRDLARDLANIYHTRIELRQIGVRDKAKEISGLGICGQKLCCARYINEFESVSISMAKNQNLALNPNKINGVCGRLLCCLKYENDYYTECRKECPKIGQTVSTVSGEGKVISIDVIQKKYKVETNNGVVEENINGNN